MPAGSDNFTAPVAPVARRTARRHKPSRRYLDAGLLNALAPASPPMRAQSLPGVLQESRPERQEGVEASPTPRQKAVRPRTADPDYDAETASTPRRRKRPRTAVGGEQRHGDDFAVHSPPSLSPHITIVKLWDNISMKLRNDVVALPDLIQVLAENETLSLYMGQSNSDFPDNLRDTMLCDEDLSNWREELLKPGIHRRVMIFDPAELAIVPHRKSPTIHHLEEFISNAVKHKPLNKQLRMFAAEHTSFYCLSDGMREYVERMSRRRPNVRGSDPTSSGDADALSQDLSHTAQHEGDHTRQRRGESCDDVSEVSKGICIDYLEGEESEPDPDNVPAFRKPMTVPQQVHTFLSHDESHSDVSASSCDLVASLDDTEQGIEENKRWLVGDGSCGSKDSIFDNPLRNRRLETNGDSYCFEEEEVLDGSDMNRDQSNSICAGASGSGKGEENETWQGLHRHGADALRENKVSEVPQKLSQTQDVVRGRGQAKTYAAHGGNKFRTNPVGPDETPIESEPYSTHVYIWNYDDERRDDNIMPLQDAIKICKLSKKPFLGIYDGQDYDFESGPLSWKIHMFHYDVDRWASRGVVQDHKVRIWNRSQFSFRAFQFCPLLSRLGPWLREHPDLSIFNPSSLDPTCSVQYDARSLPIRQYLSSALRASSLVWNRLLRRIRQIGVIGVDATSIPDVEFWNAAKRCREKREPFKSRAQLALFLLASPWVELYSRQGEVEQFELSSGFRLTPIFANCPAELACFWDKRNEEKFIQPGDDPDFKGKTIFECLACNKFLELYLGQDTPHFGAVSNAVETAHRSGSYPYLYMLAYTGDQAREILSKGWVAVYVDALRRSTGCAVFWKEKEKALQMQPDLATFSSIQDYLDRHAGSTELYTGQDLADDVSEDISKFFKLLTYKPGYSCSSHKPMITKLSFLPAPGVLKNEVEGKLFDASRCSTVPKGTVRDKHKLPVSRTYIEEGHQNLRYGTGRQLSSKRTSASVVAVNTRTSSNKVSAPGAPSVKLKATAEEPALDLTNCSDDIHDGSTEIPGSHTPESSTLNEQDAYEDSLESDLSRDDRNVQVAACNEASDSAFWEAPLSRTREKANRMSNLIREAGPKILNRQLKQDLRQTLREDLLRDVDSSSTLVALASRLRSSDFVFAALDLCAKLEALDIYNCFSNTTDFGYGPPDLLSIRTDLEAGKIHTIAGVVEKFRRICADLTQFHRDCALLNEAVLLQHDGEKAIEDFAAENGELVREEERISRIGSICERGRKIGFQENRARRNSRKTTCLKSPVKAKPSIRVPGYQSHVTFLNYRDEKGYSVMGKRHSARVFGLSIDHRACEARAGNVRPCHVCERELFQSEGDSLQCANHRLHLCEEMMCRSCLESIFSVSEREFDGWRKSDNWICVHCRGLCVQRGPGQPSRCSLYDKARSLHEGDVQFVWRLGAKNACSIVIVLAMRSIGGDFAGFADGTTRTLLLAKDESGLAWRATAKLPVGAYRCRVDVDGTWQFSTTFQVLLPPGHENASDGQAAALSAQTWNSNPCVPVGFAPGKRHIEWKIVEQTRKESRPVHSFSKTNGGAFVRTCSRTEGYDWNRSKRHAIIQWIPEVSQKVSTEPCNGGEPKFQELRLTASTRTVSTIFRMSGFPRPKVGMSWRHFEQEVNAFKFDYMRNETLWGIVTGTSRIHGIGLFTQTGYQKGDFVIEYAGDLIRTPLGDIREKRYEAEGLGTYLFKIDEHKIVDATVKSNRARFTNHSCDPNMAAKIVNVRGRDLVVLIATRNIPTFAELTFNYQLPYEDKKLECLCNSWNCVGVMN